LNCVLKSKREVFGRVPSHKSLWNSPPQVGLPIGNLTSQFFANVYLDVLDQFVKHTLRAKYYFRYVDDWVILDPSSKMLNQQFDAIDSFLREKLKLNLHPFKKRIAPIALGIDFIGFIHKPFYRQIRPRTAGKMISLAHQWRKNPNGLSPSALNRLRDSVNSYFGISRWASSYNLRKHVGDQVNSLFVQPDKDCLKLMLPKGTR
jgi:RNA-directed DNA polymerase